MKFIPFLSELVEPGYAPLLATDIYFLRLETLSLGGRQSDSLAAVPGKKTLA